MGLHFGQSNRRPPFQQERYENEPFHKTQAAWQHDFYGIAKRIIMNDLQIAIFSTFSYTPFQAVNGAPNGFKNRKATMAVTIWISIPRTRPNVIFHRFNRFAAVSSANWGGR